MQKPNIIIVLIDDMGWKDLGCTGSSFYETPNIDRLCREGMNFSEAYAACPVCSPSRASMLTGKYPARLGITDWIDWHGENHPCKGKLIDAPYVKQLPKTEHSLAQALADQGYAAWHVGKWHLGGADCTPLEFGFEKNIGGCHWGNPKNGYFSPYGIPGLPEGPAGEYLTDRLTDEAISLIENSTEQPFFLNLWHYTVHTPIQAKAQDVQRFREKARLLQLDQINPIVPGSFFPTEHKRGQRISRRIIQSDPVYAAMIWNLDQNIGRLMDALSRVKKADNTLVIFTSDNGGLSTAEGSPTCNLPAAQGKGWTHEGGLRVPLLLWMPGTVPAETDCREPVTTPDIYPTLLELCGAPALESQHKDGRSLLPLVQGKKLPERPLFWHYPHYGNQGGTPGAAVRLGNYKLIEFFQDGRLELYNLQEDIGETINLADREPEITARLYKYLQDWQREVCAVFPQQNPNWTEL